jgi:hypothetical protein
MNMYEHVGAAYFLCGTNSHSPSGMVAPKRMSFVQNRQFQKTQANRRACGDDFKIRHWNWAGTTTKLELTYGDRCDCFVCVFVGGQRCIVAYVVIVLEQSTHSLQAYATNEVGMEFCLAVSSAMW